VVSSQVDAFATEPFKGNPAAVCLLEEENAAGAAADERWMQSVAAEFNLSETAFLVRDSSRPAGAAPRFHLRWFTPLTEVALLSLHPLHESRSSILLLLTDCSEEPVDSHGLLP
jgi:PhzF family phenazine biosynthesis protein